MSEKSTGGKNVGSYQLATAPKRTERIDRLCSLVRNQEWEVFIDRARYVTETYKESFAYHPIIRRAKALENVLMKQPVYILPGSLIVGNLAAKPRGTPLFPEYQAEWLKREFFNEESERLANLDGDYYYPPDRPADTFKIDDAILSELKEILNWWEGKTHQEELYNIIPENARLAHDVVKVLNIQDYIQGGIGHFAPDYAWLLKNGLAKVIRICEQKLHDLKMHEPTTFEKRLFYEAATISCKAVINYAHRYQDLAKKEASATSDSERRRELLEIAKICNKVPMKPAETFHEALQFIFFIHLCTQIEESGQGISVGRFDQLVINYYGNDIKVGRLSRKKALELIENLFVKIYEMNKIKSWGCTNYFRGTPMFQNLTIGGQDPNTFEDATNEISYLVLEALANTRLENPSITARWHPKAPEEYKKKVAETIRIGIGFPAVFSDSLYIPALMNRGVGIGDAYNYCIIGCVEGAPQGLLGGRTGGAWFNLAKVFEMTLYGGKDPGTKLTIHPNKSGKNLSTYSSFAELWSDFLDQIDYYSAIEAIWENAVDYTFERSFPAPFSSVVACPTTVLERGKPLRAGGAKYDFTGQQTIGTANVGNSLYDIKRLVFEEHKISSEALLHALETNFQDKTTDPTGDEIRHLCLSVPKYGNDYDPVDYITRDVLAYVCEQFPKYKNTRYGRGPIGGIMHASTSTVSSNTPFGKVVGALPDGRPAGTPLSDGQSPMRGTDTQGPTAAVNSVAKLKNVLISDGSLYNMKLPPSELEGEGLQKFIALIDYYFYRASL